MSINVIKVVSESFHGSTSYVMKKTFMHCISKIVSIIAYDLFMFY